MRDTVTYEWTLEFVDENGDIQDLDQHDDFESARKEVEGFEPCEMFHHVDFCLVKRWGNEYDGETDRGYAYITRNDDGSLTIGKEFSNGESVNKSHRRAVGDDGCESDPDVVVELSSGQTLGGESA